jgi:2-keto-4-pentenoate hydratase/2-oxohepta-3-ene-1,7-dioic acid hydratase in catechol pathway
MKLANLDGRATLLRLAAGAIDVAKASDGRFGPDIQSIYDEWPAFREFAAGLESDADSGTAAEAVAREAALGPIAEERLGCPVPHPRQVFAIGLNYRSHAEESGMDIPSIPATFTKFPTCLTGPYDEVPLSGPTVDWEVELVAVVGRRAVRVDEADGWSYIAGLAVGQDVSDRVVQFAAGSQFSLGKSFPGYGPIGPWLVTPDELDDPDDLALGCAIDGETLQEARTSDLIFNVPRLVAELSAVVTLLPGDVIFTGTPAGIGATRQPPRFLQPGETVESWVAGIGTIRNRFVSEER